MRVSTPSIGCRSVRHRRCQRCTAAACLGRLCAAKLVAIDAFDAHSGGRFDHYQFTWTAYLENGGTLEKAQMMAAHESPRTTKLYNRTADQITLDEVERIAN